MPAASANVTARLATAHLALAALAAAGLVFVLLARPDVDVPARLQLAGQLVHWAALFYLLVTATMHARVARNLPREAPCGERPQWYPAAAGGQVAVLAAVAGVMIRGTSARSYHAGAVGLVSTLGTISLLASVVTLVTWWKCGGKAADPTAPPARRVLYLRWVVYAVAGWLVAAGIVLLECHTLPRPPGRGTDVSSTIDLTTGSRTRHGSKNTCHCRRCVSDGACLACRCLWTAGEFFRN